MIRIDWVKAEFLRKVNQNATQDNLSIDDYRFISTFNEAQVSYMRWLMDNRRNDEITPATPFLVPNVGLELHQKVDNHYDYKLPSDVFEKTAVILYADKENCKKQRIRTYERKAENIDIFDLDENNGADFRYRQANYTYNANGLALYVGDMVPSQVLLTYYRYPTSVDIVGYYHPDKSESKNKHPDTGWDLDAIYNIMKIMVFKYNVDNNINKTQIDALVTKDKMY